MTLNNPSRPSFVGGYRYNRLGAWLRQRFGKRVQKVTIRAGFGCPNRDGRINTGGCIFCSPYSLIPTGADPRQSISEQIHSGLEMARRRFKTDSAIAYFQDGTATDAPILRLRQLYTSAINHPEVLALSIGTRPDWVPDDVLDLLAELNRKKPVWLELGLQVADDEMLEFLNRGHTTATFVDAVKRAHARGLEVITHVILDIPGETPEHRSATAKCLNDNGVEGVKIHNLHVLKETALADLFHEGKFLPDSIEGYADRVVDFLEQLNPGIVIHRISGQGPEHLMLAPDWSRDKKRIIGTIEAVMRQRDSWQGKKSSCPQPAGMLRSANP